MAINIGQYAPVFLLRGNPPDRETWQASLQGCKESSKRYHRRDSGYIGTIFFFFACGSSAPVELSVKVVQLLGLLGPWWGQVCRDMCCLCTRGYGPIRAFYRAFPSWRSERLYGQSFSVALPIQALRGLPCLCPSLLLDASGT